MNYSKIPLAQTVVSLCQAHDISHIVISPGSRNAPLTIGFTHDDFFNCYSIVDERCAAFFALGMAQQLKIPVALVCTSGSALLNYYPAITEAYYSNIPLVVLSADRPKHLVDIGDGQTIKQKNVYGEHVYYSANLKLDLREDTQNIKAEDVPIFKAMTNASERMFELQKDIQRYNEAEIHKAIQTSILCSGPVHINIPFDEPLYDRVEAPTINIEPFKIETRTDHIDEDALNQCVDIWNTSSKKIILVGVLEPNAIDTDILHALINDDSVLVFSETTSNLHHPDIFSSIDKVIAPLTEEEFKKLQPEVLVTFGGMIVSKKIKAFLRQYTPKHHWHIGKHKANDTFFCLNKHIKTTPQSFFEVFLPKVTRRLKVSSAYKLHWLKVRDKRRKRHDDYLATIPFSDFIAFNSILKRIPKNSQLQVGNSSAIRYIQLFQLREDISVFCNRGTSGIDGSTSTAIGAAIANPQRTTFITGDLSFFYDSNALWNNYIPNSFRVIVINNHGGGIFRILPGHKNTENFDTYFETKHQLTAEQLCKMFHFEYAAASDKISLEKQLKSFYDEADKPKLLEIFTPSRDNDRVLLDYFTFIK